MISENAIHVRGEASRQLDAQTAAFLAAGGTIQHLPAPTFAPKPLQEVRYCLTPPVHVRRRKPEPEPIRPAAGLPPPPRREKAADREKDARAARDAHLKELAKTMTSAQASEATGVPLRTVAYIAKRDGFQFQTNFGIDEAEDAKLIGRIPRLKNIGLTRRQCARTLGISQTMLRRLLAKSGIDYPTVAGRPR